MAAMVALLMCVPCAVTGEAGGVWDAPGLVCFEVEKSFAATIEAGGSDARRVMSAENTIGIVFEAIQVVSVEPYFRRPARAPRTPQEERLSRIYRAEYMSEVEPEDAAALFVSSPAVAGAAPVRVRELAGLPDDPRFGEQWGLRNSADFDMDVPEAWDVTLGDTSVVVAVLDTGLDRRHPDLGGFSPEASGNVWVNYEEAHGEEGVDDDNNGFIDDIWGWDFVHYTDPSPLPYPGEDAVDEDGDPSDFHGHGTAVAGVIGAIGNNGEGISGLMWRCKVMGLRCGVTLRYSGQKVGVVRMDWCAGAVVYAADNGAAAINASWESGEDPGLEAAVDYAISVGAVVAVAAGNRSRDPGDLTSLNYLSSRGDCIDVASVTESGRRRYDSNFGAWVDINAPGSEILTLSFAAPDVRGYRLWNGTSFAAPAVAAAAALVKSRHPEWTPEQVRSYLEATSVPMSPPDTTIGSGTLNLFGALRSADGGWRSRIDGVLSTNLLPAGSDGEARAIVGGLSDGRGMAWGVDGPALAGWPVSVSEEELVGIATGDCDSDDEPEVVYVDAAGRLSVVELGGAVQSSWSAGAPPVGNPALADIDGDAAHEVVLCTADSTVHAWKADGAYVAGWPVSLESAPAGAPACGDVDRDGGVEVVVSCAGGTVHSLSRDGADIYGFPVSSGVELVTAPTLAALSGDDEAPEIVVAASGGAVFAWDKDGAVPVGWPVETGGEVGAAGLSAADVNGDGADEVALVVNGSIALYGAGGTLVTGWPSGVAGDGSPVLIADVTGDSIPDFVAAGGGGVGALNVDGTAIGNWPKPSDGAPNPGFASGDFDGDGRPELVAGTADGWLHCWDLEEVDYIESASLWPLPGRTTGNWRLSASAGPGDPHGPGPGEPFRVVSLTAAPNPVTAGTTFFTEIVGHIDSRRLEEIRIYDVAGRLVKSMRFEARGPGIYRDYWDGVTTGGDRVASGIYICVASVDGNTASCALIVVG
jgi:subtilisin family serine protease